MTCVFCFLPVYSVCKLLVRQSHGTGTEHKHCDIAAIKVIVEEAGGKVTDLFGNEQRYDKDIKGAIISNKVVYDEVLNTIKKYLK